MQHKIIRKLKSEEGSSLAFVIIIGVVILMLVASIMAIANSDFTFTQQSLESRQAYIDAKSVIEYGKIKINNDMKYINNYNLDKNRLSVLEQIKKPTDEQKAEISNLNIEIAGLQTEINRICSDYPFKIYGLKNDVSGNIDSHSLIYQENDVAKPSGMELLGICTITPNANEVALTYTFNIDVQNLRRELNYKVTIPIQSTDGSGGSVIPGYDASAKNANIHTPGNGNNDKVMINIQGEGNEKADENGVLDVEKFDLSLDIGRDKDNNSKFEWLNGKKLILMAKNIYVTAPMPTEGVWQAEFNLGDRNKTDTIWFKQDYEQKNNSSNKTYTFKAKTVIFDGDLTIGDQTNLNIECDTLWVKGNININVPGGTKSNFTVNAKNIIVGDYTKNSGGNITIMDRSTIVWNCTDSIMIRGKADFLTNSTDFTNPENKLTAKNISIGTESNPSTVTVQNKTKIIWDCENFWLHGDMTTTTAESYQEFNNIIYFKSGKINLSDRCNLFITGKANSKNQMFVDGVIPLQSNAYNVKIKNFELLYCNGDFGLYDNSVLDLVAGNVVVTGKFTARRTGALNINTQYLDINGKTYLDNSLVNITGNGTLKTRLNGYEQYNSTVNVSGAEKVILESPVTLRYDNPPTLTLNIKSDSIYVDDTSGDIKKNTQFIYSGKVDGTGTDFYFYPNQISYIDCETNRIIKPGKYSGVTGKKLEDLPSEPEVYTPPPIWPSLSIVSLNPSEPSASDILNASQQGDQNADNKRGTESYY